VCCLKNKKLEISDGDKLATNLSGARLRRTDRRINGQTDNVAAIAYMWPRLHDAVRQKRSAFEIVPTVQHISLSFRNQILLATKRNAHVWLKYRQTNV